MKLLLAPIVITPTKALTPSHVKGLLWLDVLNRSTSQVCDVTYTWNLRPYNVTAQTLEYWEYLDRTLGSGVDYSSWTELELSKPYVTMHASNDRGAFAALSPYLEAVESDGYVHPASRRLLEIWEGHLGRLKVEDRGLWRNDPPGLSTREVIEALEERSLCIDHRRYGGPLLLDVTNEGLPLRQAITPDGHANYLVCVLRELLPQIDAHDRVLLVHDKEIEADYVLLERILSAFGASVERIAIGRVPLDGKVLSSRHGGWERYMVDALHEAAASEFDTAEFRLAMRLYFIAVLTRDSPQALDLEVLRKQHLRARRLLGSNEEDGGNEELHPFLDQRLTEAGYVDPYRLTVSLLDRHRPTPRRALLNSVFL